MLPNSISNKLAYYCSAAHHINSNSNICTLIPKQNESTLSRVSSTVENIENYFLDLANLLIIAPRDARRDGNGNNHGEIAFNLISTKFHELPTDNWLQILDTFHSANQSFDHNVNLFPDNLNNLQGRTVRASMFNYQPYTIITEVVSIKNGENLFVIRIERHHGNVPLAAILNSMESIIFVFWNTYFSI